MRKAAIIAALLAIIQALSGCEQISRGRIEIDKLFIVRIVSIDKGQNGGIKVTLTTKSLSQGGAGTEAKQMGESIMAEGETISEAVRSLQAYSDRKPSFGHTELILLGEAIAKEGIQKYLDFFSRMYEIRNNARVYIVKGDTASNLVKTTNTSKMFVGDRILSIEETVPDTSLSSTVTLNEAISVLDNQNLDLFLPFIETSGTRTIEEQEKNAKDLFLRGYGIFKADKLSYYASEDESIGINWIMNRVRSEIIVAKSKNGDKVSLEIIYANTKLQPKIDGSLLRCTVNLSFITNMMEVMGTENVVEQDIINYLVGQQEKIIMQKVESTLRESQERNSDHFSLLSKFIIKYPMMRDYLEENWKELYPNIKFDIRIESQIKGTYLINEPAGKDKGASGT